MTVCVAAFAEKSRAIVMVSDKAATHGSVVGSDTDIQKMLPIRKSRWRALVAGDPSFAKKVIGKVAAAIEADKSVGDTHHAMQNCVTASYRAVREQAAIDMILAPRMLTRDLVVARPQTLLPLPGSWSDDVLEELRAFKSDTQLLVCGFDAILRKSDTPRPHMFSVLDPGIAIDHDMSGYHAIGSGAPIAITRLLSWDVNRNKNLPEVLYRVFDAKAHAEIINTVGFSWDGYILTPKRGWRVKRRIRGAMDDLFSAMNRSPFEKSPPTSIVPRKKRVLKFTSIIVKKMR